MPATIDPETQDFLDGLYRSREPQSILHWEYLAAFLRRTVPEPLIAFLYPEVGGSRPIDFTTESCIVHCSIQIPGHATIWLSCQYNDQTEGYWKLDRWAVTRGGFMSSQHECKSLEGAVYLARQLWLVSQAQASAAAIAAPEEAAPILQ